MNIRIIEKYLPIRIIYINSHSRHVEMFGIINGSIIHIGEHRYFRQLSDTTKLIKSNDTNGIQVGTIIEFEYLTVCDDDEMIEVSK